MKLRDIDFGHVLGASGVQGFFGEGYRFHRFMKPFGLDFTGMTFVAKTATLYPRQGNMPLTANLMPRDKFPDCIRGKITRGVMLNAVGLSNPGLAYLLDTGQWQQRAKPFFLSLMCVAATPAERLDEMSRMVDLLRKHRGNFNAPFGLQLNLSCPNTSHDPRTLISEATVILDIAATLGVPLMPKFSIASAPVAAVMELNNHHACDAICVSNTIPFGWEGLDWKKIWGSDRSPLFRYGGGGLSGKVLGPLVRDWIMKLRAAGFTKPINGGGGILSIQDAVHYWEAGADSIFLGSVASLRPWRVRSIINHANTFLQWRFPYGVSGHSASQ